MIGIGTIIREGQGVMFNLHFTLTEKKKYLNFFKQLRINSYLKVVNLIIYSFFVWKSKYKEKI